MVVGLLHLLWLEGLYVLGPGIDLATSMSFIMQVLLQVQAAVKVITIYDACANFKIKLSDYLGQSTVSLVAKGKKKKKRKYRYNPRRRNMACKISICVACTLKVS